MANSRSSKARRDHYIQTAIKHYSVLDPLISFWLMSNMPPALIFLHENMNGPISPLLVWEIINS